LWFCEKIFNAYETGALLDILYKSTLDRVMVVQSSARKVVRAGLKGIKFNYIEILRKNFAGHLFLRNKIDIEDILSLNSLQ